MQLRTPMQMQSTANYIFVMVCNWTAFKIE